MANPYHNAKGEFCSRNEMSAAINQAAESGDLDSYFALRRDFELIEAKKIEVSQEFFSDLRANAGNSPRSYRKNEDTDYEALYQSALLSEDAGYRNKQLLHILDNQNAPYEVRNTIMNFNDEGFQKTLIRAVADRHTSALSRNRAEELYQIHKDDKYVVHDMLSANYPLDVERKIAIIEETGNQEYFYKIGEDFSVYNNPSYAAVKEELYSRYEAELKEPGQGDADLYAENIVKHERDEYRVARVLKYTDNPRVFRSALHENSLSNNNAATVFERYAQNGNLSDVERLWSYEYPGPKGERHARWAEYTAGAKLRPGKAPEKVDELEGYHKDYKQAFVDSHKWNYRKLNQAIRHAKAQKDKSLPLLELRKENVETFLRLEIAVDKLRSSYFD